VNPDPEDLDVRVYGSTEAARQAQIDSSLNGLVELARQHLAQGGSPAQVAAVLEYSFTAKDGDTKANIGLAHAVVRLALLPKPASSKVIRQWTYTDNLGLPHVFEDELLAVRAALTFCHGQLSTPDGDVYIIDRIRRGRPR